MNHWATYSASMIFMAGLALVASCAGGPSVQVYTNSTTHQLVIAANKNCPASSPTPAPKPAPKPRPRVVYKPTPKPKPVTWIPYKPTPIVHRPYRAPVKKKKSAVVKVATAALSLSDQITRLLPGSTLQYQPSRDVVTGLPVYFWSNTNPLFNVATSILGVGVSVFMTPSFVWNFGDGTTESSSKDGGPYPTGTVTHIYKTSGIYTATVTISWAGSWAAAGAALLPVLGGAIVQSASASIQVAPGPTQFTA